MTDKLGERLREVEMMAALNKKSMEDHEGLCAERYKNINKSVKALDKKQDEAADRQLQIEDKLDTIVKSIAEGRGAVRVLWWAGGIFATILGALKAIHFK